MSDKKECSGEMIPANINDILEELPEDKRKVIVSTMQESGEDQARHC